jgi:hypothetical protein
VARDFWRIDVGEASAAVRERLESAEEKPLRELYDWAAWWHEPRPSATQGTQEARAGRQVVWTSTSWWHEPSPRATLRPVIHACADALGMCPQFYRVMLGMCAATVLSVASGQLVLAASLYRRVAEQISLRPLFSFASGQLVLAANTYKNVVERVAFSQA